MSLLDVRNLSVQFHNEAEDNEAVRSVSFSVEPGEIVGIVGESGSGKSTLVRAVIELLPEHAQVSYDRCEMEGGRGKMAMVFQDPLNFLDPTVKVGRQITETIRIHRKMNRKEAEERAVELMEIAGIRHAKERMRQYPFELSGGLRQRVVLAIALACEPQLLIADEPTTALDVTVQRQILDRLKRISQEMGMAVVIVSHDLGVIAALADRVLVMQKGQIVESGDVDSVFYEPEHPYTQELFRYAKCAETFRKWEKHQEDSREILRAKQLVKQYKKNSFLKSTDQNEAVCGVSLTLYEGETFGVVGESGCGKTTLAGMLTGIVEPTEGSLYYRGEPLLSLDRGRSREQIQKIQMVFQDVSASLDSRCTIGEILEEPLLTGKKGSQKERMEKVYELLEQVGLAKEDADKYPEKFSGGQRQRIGIARALITEPDILVLDEPVSALDVAIQEQILELLHHFQKEKGLTYLFISHDLGVVRRISRRLGVMYAGRFVETGDTKEVYEDPWHPYTKALLSSSLSVNPKKARKKKTVLLSDEQGVAEKGKRAGCPYAACCGYAMECCREEIPALYRFGSREVACFLYSEEHTGKRSASYKMGAQI